MADQNQSPSGQNQIRNFYNTIYDKENDRPIRKPSRHYSRLASKINIKPGQHVLDVACGKGEWLLAIVKRGGNPSGIDISNKAVDICKTILPHGEFYTEPAETLPFKDKKFDVVSCLGALEHFLDPEKALKEMIRTAKDDAIFLILVPNKGFLTRRLGLYKGTAQTELREEWHTLEEWEELFQSAGLQIKKRWKDLHVLSWSWINAKKWYYIPLRAFQAFSLIFWPTPWQYQIYHLCIKKIEY